MRIQMLKTTQLLALMLLAATSYAWTSETTESSSGTTSSSASSTKDYDLSTQHMQLIVDVAVKIATNPELSYEEKFGSLDRLFIRECSQAHGPEHFEKISQIKNRYLMWQKLQYPHLQALACLITLVIDSGDSKQPITSVDFKISYEFGIANAMFPINTALLSMAASLNVEHLYNALKLYGADIECLLDEKSPVSLLNTCKSGNVTFAQTILRDIKSAKLKKDNPIIYYLLESGNDSAE